MPGSGVLVAQLGARRHYVVPASLHAAGALSALCTDACAATPIVRALSTMLPTGLRPPVLRAAIARKVPGVPTKCIRSAPLLAATRAWRARRAKTPGARRSVHLHANHVFGRFARTQVGDAGAVYAFNTAALELFRAARERGLACYLDQSSAPMAFEKETMEEEYRRWPDWESPIDFSGAWHDLAAREEEEWGLADHIICGSDFVRTTLQTRGALRARCHVVPYGIQAPAAPPAVRKRSGSRPLHVLYAGALRLQKGVQYLAEAARHCDERRFLFRAVGPNALLPAATEQICARIEWRGSIPRERMAECYAWADVLVMPSLSEGSANVCYEAIAQGLPVVATTSSGSVIRDGKEGYLVPPRDGRAMADALQALAEEPGRLAALSTAAQLRAREFSPDHYRTKLMNAIGFASTKGNADGQ